MQLRPGTVLAGKYLILKPLGKGGEGSVWLAVHQKTEQLWAIKEIFQAEDREGIHEIDMMKQLNYACLPKVLDVLEDKNHKYLIMEYIRGNTLECMRKRYGRLSAELVLEVGIQLCGALCYLHGREKPVYHLDIKPSNLIWKKNGRLMLVDFGAAWKNSVRDSKHMAEMESDSGGVRNGLGTEGYAAPEQYDSFRGVDARTDIYGVGATLYHLISGVRYSKMMRKSRIPGCPERLGEVIKKCVAENPESRYENCRELQKALIKIKKKQNYQKRRVQIWSSLFLSLLVLGIAARELPREFLQQNGSEWNYEHLLAEALCVSPADEYGYYQRAALLQPSNPAAYLQLLEQAEQDGCYTKEEELQVRKLLHTIPLGQDKTYEELLMENAPGYAEFAGRTGMAYWYEYEGEEGRRIASGWFSKACQSLERWKQPETRGQEETSGQPERPGQEEASGQPERPGQEEPSGQPEKPADWMVQIEIFARIGSYYERLGQPDETGSAQEAAGTYWSDLNEIYEKNLEETMSSVMKLRFWEETVNQIIFLAVDFQNVGVEKQAMQSRIEEIIQKADGILPKTVLEQELMENVKAQARTAMQRVDRLGGRPHTEEGGR